MIEQWIESLHGRYFTAEICFEDVVGRISHDGSDVMYLCHNNPDIRLKPIGCGDMLGYEYGWPIWFGESNNAVQNLKILPSPLEYHELFNLILSQRESTWDVDGSYSVLPKDVVSKIADFMEGMKIFGNNQNSIK